MAVAVIVGLALVGAVLLLAAEGLTYVDTIDRIEDSRCNSQYHERIWDPTPGDQSSP